MKILIADDERELAHAFAVFLEGIGHETTCVVTGGLDVLAAYDRFIPDVVIMDILMPRFNGITISHALLSKNPKVKIVLISGKLERDHPFIVNSGASRFLAKPVQFSELKKVLDELDDVALAASAAA
jgi:CheY-like chemotaxis protein